MKTIKARAIVLREYEAGESDKRLLLLCKEHGRIFAYARGARKPKSKFLAAAQLFTYADFVLVQGQGFYSVAQADMIENFYALRQDYDILMTACDLVGYCEKTLWDNINCDELILLLLKSFSHLSKGRVPAEQVKCVFLYRFFMFHGIQLQADTCIECGVGVHEMTGGIFISQEGVTCKLHRTHHHRPISAAAAAALQFIQQSGLSQAFLFDLQSEYLTELYNVAKLVNAYHF